jgi:hypothetical protein
MEPPIFLCQYTLVIGRLEDTVHTKVTVFPEFTEYDDCCTWTVGTAKNRTQLIEHKIVI